MVVLGHVHRLRRALTGVGGTSKIVVAIQWEGRLGDKCIMMAWGGLLDACHVVCAKRKTWIWCGPGASGGAL